MAVIALRSSMAGRPAFFFGFGGGSKGFILAHNSSGIWYSGPTPVL
jgi:hypothetical protein